GALPAGARRVAAAAAAVQPVTVTPLHSRCSECGAELAPGLLACPGCSRLVHSAELGRLASAAGQAAGAGDLSGALASWRRATQLLPAASEQHAQIVERMKALSAAVDGRGPAPAGVGTKGSSKGAKTGAAIGAVGLALAKSKAILLLLAG